MDAVHLFLQVDASPQFGRDWLLSVATYVRQSDVPSLRDMLRELYSLGQEVASYDEHEDAELVAAATLRRRELSDKVSGQQQQQQAAETEVEAEAGTTKSKSN